MRAYRICLEEHGTTPAQAFNGLGGVYTYGRWNSAGKPIVYAGSHLSLAALEVFVHLHGISKLKPFVHYELEIPDTIVVEVRVLPADWTTNEHKTREIGDGWLRDKSSAVLSVPSAIIPAERNLLINPVHPGFDLGWVTKGPTRFQFDSRLLDRVR